MNAIQRVPTSFHVRRDFDGLREAANRYATDNYTAGVAQGKREMRWWAVRYTGVYVLLGTCFGVVLTIVAAGVVL